MRSGGRSIMDYFAGKWLTHDWFSGHIDHLEHLLSEFRDRDVSVLEIGSFEGRSALFFLQYLKKARLTCIDTFAGSSEHKDQSSPHYSDTDEIESRFDRNLTEFGDRVTKLKGPSIAWLPTLQESLQESARRFEVIYIDGDHHAASVYTDASLAWTLLADGGVMIFDDFQWNLSSPVEERPAAGVEAFLTSVEGQYTLLHRGYQVVIKKLAADHALASSVEILFQGKQSPLFTPPLVSLILVNWNYGRFVTQTINSIIAQDYPNFECIVVDNGSSDDSREVIARLIAGDRRFRVIHLPENKGQLGAVFVALREITGNFVAIIDADDFLLPQFLSTHIQAHLMAGRSVGITSSNVGEVDEAGNLLTSQYVTLRAAHENAIRGTRSADAALRLSTISDESYRVLQDAMAVLQQHCAGWLWAPGSANVMRRSIIELCRRDDDDRRFMRPADNYFLPLCHMFSGTAVIDVPLSGYRLHGKNYFSVRESIGGLTSGTPEYWARNNRDWLENIETVLQHAERNAFLLGSQFWRSLDALAMAPDLLGFYRDRGCVELFTRYATVLRRASRSDKEFIVNICARLGARRSREVIVAAFDGHIPMKAHWRMLKLALSKRKRARVLQLWLLSLAVGTLAADAM